MEGLAAELELWIPGDPKPQGSKRAFVHPGTGRAVIVEDNKRLRPWRTSVNEALREAGFERPLEDPVWVELTFYLPRPPSVSARRRPLPGVAPDVDKLARACLDAMSRVVIRDDALVTSLRAVKRYATGLPGVRVRIGKDLP